MYRVGICGHFGYKKELLNGQTIKTKILYQELKKYFGEHAVKIVDTHGWKRNPIAILIKMIILVKNCKNIIILPAQNGLKVIAPLFFLLNKIFNKNIHYVVIGGWLPDFLNNNHKMKIVLRQFKGIYVETNSMKKMLEKMGLSNVYYLPNFKRLKILDEDELNIVFEEPYKLCTFSRVLKEKGIEDAIESVKAVNELYGRIVYTLDIYGQIDGNYKDRFKELEKNFPSYISYKGTVDYENSVNVLKNYFALLFPTYYEGEGFAGTIIDAYAAGVPVIATDWKYNKEIIKDKQDGLLYDYKNKNKLKEILTNIIKNPNSIVEMKNNCLKRAKEFTPEVALKAIIMKL